MARGILASLLCLQLIAGPAAESLLDLAAERAKVQAQFPAAFAPGTDDPALPRVLLIGDSISIGYTPEVRALLRGRANVHRIPDNGGPTSRGLQQLDEWLGPGRWDVIHFNFGLHDIARVREGEMRLTAADYERNLRELVVRLRATGARLVFATTTPVPDPLRSGPHRREADAVAANVIARRVMSAAGVTVTDLHAVVGPRLAELQLPANVHFTAQGSRVLAEAVAAGIIPQLPPAGATP